MASKKKRWVPKRILAQAAESNHQRRSGLYPPHSQGCVDTKRSEKKKLARKFWFQFKFAPPSGLHGLPLAIVGFIRILKTTSVSVCGLGTCPDSEPVQSFLTIEGMTKYLTPLPALIHNSYLLLDNSCCHGNSTPHRWDRHLVWVRNIFRENSVQIFGTCGTSWIIRTVKTSYRNIQRSTATRSEVTVKHKNCVFYCVWGHNVTLIQAYCRKHPTGFGLNKLQLWPAVWGPEDASHLLAACWKTARSASEQDPNRNTLSSWYAGRQWSAVTFEFVRDGAIWWFRFHADLLTAYCREK